MIALADQVETGTAQMSLVGPDGRTPLSIAEATGPELARNVGVIQSVFDQHRARHPSPLVRTHNGMLTLKDVAEGAFVGGLLEQRTDAVIARELEIRPASDDERDVLIAEFVKWNFEEMAGSFRDNLRSILSCITYGYSIQEMIFADVPTTPFGRRVCLAALKDKPQTQYGFIVDPFMNIKAIAPWSVLEQSFGRSGGFDPNKFVVATFRPSGGNPHGWGAAEQIWWENTFMRDNVLFWLNTNERFSQPFVSLKLPGATKPEDWNKAEEVLQHIAHQSYAVYKDNWNLELTEMRRNATADYETLERTRKENIQIAILGQTLTSSEGQHGTQALGSVHEGVMSHKTEADLELVSEIINEQIIRPLVNLNFDGIVRYPKIVEIEHEPTDQKDRVAFVTEADRLGLPMGELWTYEFLSIPKPKDGEELLTALPPNPTAPGSELPGLPGSATVDTAKGAEGQDGVQQNTAQFAHKPFWRKLTRFESKESLTAIVDETDRDLTDVVSGAADVMTVARDRIIKAVVDITEEGKQIPSGAKRLDLRDTIKTDMKKFAEIAGRANVAASLRGQVNGAKEVARSEDAVPAKFRSLTSAGKTRRRKAIEHQERFRSAAPTLAQFVDVDIELLPPKEAVDAVEALTPLTKSALATVKNEAIDNAFFLSDVESGEFVSRAQALVAEAVSNGRSTDWFISEFREAAQPWTGSGAVSGKALTEARIRTVFRTNMMSAYNAGRQKVFEDSSIAGFVTHYQYSSVLDDRTRDTHAAMDGQTYPKGDPIWGSWTPPNGFNCRCILIPITEADPPTAAEVSEDLPVIDGKAVQPDRKFGSRTGPATTDATAQVSPDGELTG